MYPFPLTLLITSNPLNLPSHPFPVPLLPWLQLPQKNSLPLCLWQYQLICVFISPPVFILLWKKKGSPQEEIDGLQKEIALLQKLLEHPPEVTRFAKENVDLRAEIKRFQQVVLRFYGTKKKEKLGKTIYLVRV